MEVKASLFKTKMQQANKYDIHKIHEQMKFSNQILTVATTGREGFEIVQIVEEIKINEKRGCCF